MAAATLIRVWVDGSDPGPMLADVDPPLGPGEVEISTDDLQVAVARSMTPKIDGDSLIQALEIERIIAARARNR